MPLRIGIFGGTFDPIHLGHLVLAESARDQLQLDRVYFVPAAIPPHKREIALTDACHRMDMVKLAVAGNPVFVASDIELKRTGVSYTVDTLRAFHAEHADAELFLLLGADNFVDLEKWYAPEEILRLASIAIVHRPGTPLADLPGQQPAPTDDAARQKYALVASPLVGISGRDIRQRILEGRSVRYLVPAAVEAYIGAHQLYRAVPTASEPK